MVYSFFLRQCYIFGLFFIQHCCCCNCMDELLVFSQEQHVLRHLLLFAFLQGYRILELSLCCLPSCCLCLLPYSIGNEVNKVRVSPQWSLINIYVFVFEIYIYDSGSSKKYLNLWVCYFSHFYTYIKFCVLVYIFLW